jgi:hypothetical protein
MIGRLGDTVCNPHRTRGGDEKHGFSALASKLVVMAKPQQRVLDLDLKTKVDGLVIWASKSP